MTSLESHCIAAESTSPVSRMQEPQEQGLHAVGVITVPETTGGMVEKREDGGWRDNEEVKTVRSGD